jgi:flagellar hook-length control protein FliK
LQQMISFVPTMPTKANQLPMTGGGEQVGAGVFQGILLEALLGARGAQAALQFLPGHPAPRPGSPAQSQSQVAAQPPVLPDQAQVTDVPIFPADVGVPALNPAQAGLPAESQATEVPVAGLPIRLTGPVPPATVAMQSPLPTDEEADVPAEPAEPAVTETDAAFIAQVQASQVQASVTQAQAMPQPPAPSPESQRPAPGQQPLPAIPEVSQTGAALEAFVQNAVQVAQGDTTIPTESAETAQQGEGGTTFEDLVKLVMNADKARPDGGSTQSDGGGAEPKGQDGTLPAEPTAPVAEETVSDPSTVSAGPEPAPAHRSQATAAADAPREAPRQPVEPEQVVRQVTRFIKVMVDAKQSEVRLNLHPEHLGHIAVKLVVGDGSIRANLVAQDMAVKAALEANLDQLKTRLTDQGFQVEQVHVSVGSDSGHPQHSRHGEQRQPQQHQAWRPTRGEAQQQDPAPTLSRPAPAPWTPRGTGARLNSLA